MKLAILDDYQNCALKLADWSRLNDRCSIVVFNEHLAYGDALVERLREFDILCVMRERTPLPRKLLEQLPDLKLVVSSGRRNAAIDTVAAKQLGITVTGTSIPGRSTAELTLALILALSRGLMDEHQSMRTGGWQRGLGRDVHGATLGVLGLGRLGSAVAEFGKVCGMQCIAWSQNLTEEHARQVGVARVDKHELLTRSDFLTIHLRLSERTTGLIGAPELARMKPTAYLINTSRGPIVDEAALLAALKKGGLAGAAVDVYDQEPLPAEHPFRGLPNLLCTPHIGYVTEQTYTVFYREMVDRVAAYLDGDGVPELN
ncbi:MAG: D-2-hydroxyacid dehydrogenase family protein [Gammaproteobacteria bacterium]|nr:D-2-hydroxyacid dehydrogenase family protein [Gammaproteobacteria bacterium]